MMMFIALLLLACFQDLSAVQWTSAYQDTTTICPGHNLKLGWEYSLEPEETVEEIKWYFSSDSEQKPPVIATYAHRQLDSAPPYRNRLIYLSEGKVVLDYATVDDAGNYTTQVVTGQRDGSKSTIRRHLVVKLADPSIYRDDALSVEMSEHAVADNHGNLHTMLTCGPIAWRGEPPVDVTWMTPSGAQRNSTGYKYDYFYLLLDNPVVRGVYTCGLSASVMPALCLEEGDALARQATFEVNSITARLLTLEANTFRMTHRLQQVEGDNFNLEGENRNLTQKLQDIKRDNIKLTQQLTALSEQLQDVKGDLTHQQVEGDNFNLTEQVEVNNVRLTQRLEQVEGDNVKLTQRLQHVEGENRNLTQKLQDIKRDINLTQQQDANLKLTLPLQQTEIDNIKLTQQLTALSQQLQDVKGDLTHQLQQVRTKQDQCRENVGNNNQRMKLLEDEFHQYRNVVSTHVAFHARLGSDTTMNKGDAVKFVAVIYNDGGAYDNTTGQFTAPVDGTYFFIFTTSPEGSGKNSNSQLVVGGEEVAAVWTRYTEYYSYATGHVAMHVRKGTRVWVTNWSSRTTYDYWSSFSGFLIQAHM